MMKLQTPVSDQKCKVELSYNDRIMLLGSCFADSIGRQLSDYGFDVCVNPFGTLYNPVSILNSVELLSGDRLFTEEDCVQMGAGSDRICSFCHHTSFSRDSREEFLAHANESLSAARDYFRSCSKVIVTLGTSWCFRHVEKGMIVSNCLKRDAKEFVRERLSVNEVAGSLRKIVDIAPDSAQFIFTVSPIRHFKDGAHGNQLSKASLLLGIDELLASEACCSCADYFPSYEILLDELRDYRFYAEDMCHPSSQAVAYIRDRFLLWALREDERNLLEDNKRKFKRSCHIDKPKCQ